MTDRKTDAGETVAIALKYERGRDPAPRVVASGRGAVADQILELAFASGVKVRKDADLADVLSAVEVDSVIPLEAFAAVAEIVAYLYRANAHIADGRSVEDGARRAADPTDWVPEPSGPAADAPRTAQGPDRWAKRPGGTGMTIDGLGKE